MILYHGSYLEITEPDLSHSRTNVDFGRRKHWDFCTLKGVKWYECKSDYHSETYPLIRDGVSDMHCMSDAYLAEELKQEYQQRNRKSDCYKIRGEHGSIHGFCTGI